MVSNTQKQQSNFANHWQNFFDRFQQKKNKKNKYKVSKTECNQENAMGHLEGKFEHKFITTPVFTHFPISQGQLFILDDPTGQVLH